MPAIASFSSTIPTCTSNNGTGSVTLTWTSTAATSAWIADSPISQPFDPTTVTGADNQGPLPPNGSVKATYDCANQFEYYDLGVYNSLGNQIESTQVANPNF